MRANLVFSDDKISSNPAIVRIEENRNESDDCYGDYLKITFFGEYKPIAEIESHSYSGSGWQYGASVVLVCEETNEEEIITEW